MSTHEDFQQNHEVRASSDRSFGVVFTAVLALAGVWPLRTGGSVRPWALALSAVFLALAFLRPSWLNPLNRVWTRFGLLLGMVVTPIATAILFYLVFTPIGLLMRLFGKDALRLRPKPDEPSYWIFRQPPGPAPSSMTQQF